MNYLTLIIEHWKYICGAVFIIASVMFFIVSYFFGNAHFYRTLTRTLKVIAVFVTLLIVFLADQLPAFLREYFLLIVCVQFFCFVVPDLAKKCTDRLRSQSNSI